MTDPFEGLDELPSIATERLVLRAITPSDASALFAIFSDEQVMRFWSSAAMVSIEEAEALAREIDALGRARTLLQWGIVVKDDPGLVGTCTLYRWERRHRRAELGYALRRDVWGRGYATEAVTGVLRFAFDAMGLHRVGADTDPRNAASARVLERLGFEREGVQRETYLHLGEWADSVMWGLVGDDGAATGKGDTPLFRAKR